MKKVQRVINRVWPRPIPKIGDEVQFGHNIGKVVAFSKAPSYGVRGMNQGAVKILIENQEQPDLPFYEYADLYAVVLPEDIVEVEL